MAFTVEGVRREMRQHVRDVAALAPNDGRKTALQFAASLLKLPYPRVRALFYGEARRIDAHEADQIRAYVKQAEQLIQARQDYEKQLVEFVKGAPRFVAKLAPPSLSPVAVREEVADQITAAPSCVPGKGRI